MSSPRALTLRISHVQAKPGAAPSRVAIAGHDVTRPFPCHVVKTIANLHPARELKTKLSRMGKTKCHKRLPAQARGARAEDRGAPSPMDRTRPGAPERRVVSTPSARCGPARRHRLLGQSAGPARAACADEARPSRAAPASARTPPFSTSRPGRLRIRLGGARIQRASGDGCARLPLRALLLIFRARPRCPRRGGGPMRAPRRAPARRDLARAAFRPARGGTAAAQIAILPMTDADLCAQPARSTSWGRREVGAPADTPQPLVHDARCTNCC